MGGARPAAPTSDPGGAYPKTNADAPRPDGRRPVSPSRTTTVTANEFTTLIQRAERGQLEAWLPPATPEIDWTAHAYRWRKRGARWLDSVRHVARIDLDDLQHIERQKNVIDRNTQQFIEKKPANNVLMTGARAPARVRWSRPCWRPTPIAACA